MHGRIRIGSSTGRTTETIRRLELFDKQVFRLGLIVHPSKNGAPSSTVPWSRQWGETSVFDKRVHVGDCLEDHVVYWVYFQQMTIHLCVSKNWCAPLLQFWRSSRCNQKKTAVINGFFKNKGINDIVAPSKISLKLLAVLNFVKNDIIEMESDASIISSLTRTCNVFFRSCRFVLQSCRCPSDTSSPDDKCTIPVHK